MIEVDVTRQDLVREFMHHPTGYHSGDLRRLLNAMRVHPGAPSYILVCMVQFRQWCLATKPPERGAAVELLDVTFDDPLEAERAVFRLRWKAITGETLSS